MAINPFQPPVNFASSIPQVDAGQSLLEGLQLGAAVKQMQRQRADDQLAEQAKVKYAQDLQATFDNPTPQSFAALSAKYPQQREAFKQSWDILSKEQKDAEFLAGAQAFNAINSGNIDVAKSLLDQRIVAMENSGQNPANMQAIRTALDGQPNAVRNQLGVILSAVDPDRWVKLSQAGTAATKAESELTEQQAKAVKAATEAKFAESTAAAELEKKGWDIQKIQSDMAIAKENSRIAALNAQLSREQNQLKRDELNTKLQQMKQDRDTAVREKAADLESARGNVDNMLNTADRLLNTPIGVVESAAGPISARTPTLSQDTADFEEMVNTLGSQSFLAQIPNIKGMGALSNAEGEKLQAALQNFSLRQSPQRLLENVREAQRLLLKARKNITARSGMPETIPDTPAAEPSQDEISALLRKYGGG